MIGSDLNSGDTIEDQPAAATIGTAEFFRTLWRATTFQGFLTIFTLPDRRTYIFKHALFAARKTQELARDHDVYFGVGLRRENL